VTSRCCSTRSDQRMSKTFHQNALELFRIFSTDYFVLQNLYNEQSIISILFYANVKNFFCTCQKIFRLSFITLYSQLLEIRAEGGRQSELTDRKRFIPDASGSGAFAAQSTEGFPSKTTTLSARYVAMMKSCSTTKAVFCP
jgi:hypothetical protein